ncbi:MAG: glutathione S-transferase family protein [Burkholderiales bacterium]
MLKILGRKTSGNTQKVLWCCDELGIEYGREDVGRTFGRNHEPAYLALNPNGRVPTIVDDGFSLWESNAIVRSLCAKHGLGTLCPSEPQHRADAERWMDWQQTTLRPAFHALGATLKKTSPAQSDKAVVESLEKGVRDAWKILDAQLATQSCVAGDRLTMADIPFCYIIHRWYKLPVEHSGFANLKAWYDKLCARPAFRRNICEVEI